MKCLWVLSSKVSKIEQLLFECFKLTRYSMKKKGLFYLTVQWLCAINR